MKRRFEEPARLSSVRALVAEFLGWLLAHPEDLHRTFALDVDATTNDLVGSKSRLIYRAWLCVAAAVGVEQVGLEHLAAELQRRGDLKVVGGKPGLARLFDACPDSIDIEATVRRLRIERRQLEIDRLRQLTGPARTMAADFRIDELVSEIYEIQSEDPSGVAA